MDTTGDGCADFTAWLGIGLLVLMTLVVPVAVFIFDREGFGLPALFLGLTIFLSLIAWYFDFEDNKVFSVIQYGSGGIGVILLFRFIFLYIRDTFVRDARSGMAEALAIPVAVVVYGLVIWLLPEGLSAGKQKSILLVVKLSVFLIISGLVYLIYR